MRDLQVHAEDKPKVNVPDDELYYELYSECSYE